MNEWRFSTLLRLAECARLRAHRSFAIAARDAASLDERSRILQRRGSRMRRALERSRATSELARSDEHRMSACVDRVRALRAAEAQCAADRASQLAAAARARADAARGRVSGAMRDVQLQTSLANAAMRRIARDRLRREERRRCAESLDTWNARRMADDD